MKVSRGFATKVQFIIDELVPPIIRDSRWFMYLPMKLVFKDDATDFMEFKDSVFRISEKKFGALYSRTAKSQELQGETDLNRACVDRILSTVSGKNVLEVGCGRGYLANKIQKKGFNITGCYIVITQKLKAAYPNIKFMAGNVENLPFKDSSFDTVVCTHTLEHVQDLQKAVSELRRVAKKQLIIVVPRQRPYKYTFSLHAHFFPYKWSVESGIGYRKSSYIEILDGDWFYYEKIR